MEIKQIDEKTAESILGNIRLPKETFCTSLEGVYSDGICPGLFTVTDKKKGHQSGFGKIFQACCDGNCEFVAKWQPDVEMALNEAEIHYEAAKVGLAPKLHEVWQCDKGVIMIMDSLERTALDELRDDDYEKIIGDVVWLLNALHSIGVVHGDPHLNNFMRDKEGKYYIIDFGKSYWIDGADDESQFEDFDNLERFIADLDSDEILEYYLELNKN